MDTLKKFAASFVTSLLGSIFKLAAAFGIGTGAAAAVCLYYGLPLVLSLFGGLIVLGVATAFFVDFS